MGESRESERRHLAGMEAFSMDQFLKFEVQRGSEDAAEVDDLGFKVKSAGLENTLLKFELEFDRPLQVSIGTAKDKLVTTIVDGSFFSSSDNGLPIPPGTKIEQPLPKMFPDKE